LAIAMIATLFNGLVLDTNVAQAENGLVLHLKFDGDMADASGTGNNAECTYGKIAYEDGIFGKAAVFNGKSYLEIADNDSLDLKEFTISLWAYKTKNMKQDVDVPYLYKDMDSEYWSTPYQFYENSDNLPEIYLHDNSYTMEMDQFYLDGRSVDIHKWFLLTATYDGDEVRMYEDGILTKKKSVTGTPTNTVGDLYIGMTDGEFFYNGLMDDLRIYDHAISAQGVVDLFDAGMAESPELLTQKDSLVAHYKFNGDTKDASALGNDAEKVAGKLTYIDGKNGKAAKFSKATYLEVIHNDSIDFDEGFTATGWVKVDKYSNAMTLFKKSGVSTTHTTNDYPFAMFMYDYEFAFNYVPFERQPGELSSYYNDDKEIIKRWVHFGITFDTEEIRWYLNGKMVKKEEVSDYAGNSLAHSSGNLMIGSDGEYFFEGALDELKLYNYKLSAAEVAADAKNVDSVSISKDNQKSIKALKVKGTVALAPSRKYIETGKSTKLTAGVTYKTSNKKIFTVSKKGVITGVKKGTATLTVTHGAVSKTYKVIVK
ncbi:MAG TPA: LamG-like jellyroll fold domain-containing protein, partial [Mobilitalea sp.]|nr:LamG-like jellyroll fold domain-containing protein [Mobilitalea sp.]